eukprot:3320620-Alexandrium_andersonii.AAC.1
MSASLVGSEMCIRDSFSRAERLGRRGPVPERQGPSTEQGEAAGKEGPVSYTHLTLPTICSV